jgi:hypothetical protein
VALGSKQKFQEEQPAVSMAETASRPTGLEEEASSSGRTRSRKILLHWPARSIARRGAAVTLVVACYFDNGA